MPDLAELLDQGELAEEDWPKLSALSTYCPMVLANQGDPGLTPMVYREYDQVFVPAFSSEAIGREFGPPDAAEWHWVPIDGLAGYVDCTRGLDGILFDPMVRSRAFDRLACVRLATARLAPGELSVRHEPLALPPSAALRQWVFDVAESMGIRANYAEIAFGELGPRSVFAYWPFGNGEFEARVRERWEENPLLDPPMFLEARGADQSL